MLPSSLVSRLLADPIGELVAQNLRHVGDRRPVSDGSESSAYLDPMQQAFLLEIVDILASETSKPPAALRNYLLRNCNFPLFKARAILEPHLVPQSIG